MKPPFRLADGTREADLAGTFDAYGPTVPPLPAPTLEIGNLDGFFALVPDGPSPEIDALARDLVVRFDRFRAPPTAADISRRRPDRLSPGQRGNLERWGYPYVMEDFRYHMTLTARVAAPDRARLAAALRSRFGSLVRVPLTGLALALFVAPDPGSPFHVRSWQRLRLTSAADPVPT